MTMPPAKATLLGRKRTKQLGNTSQTDKTDQLLAIKQQQEQEDLLLGMSDESSELINNPKATVADHPVEKFDPRKSAERIARSYQKRQKQGTPNRLAYSPMQQRQYVIGEMKKLMLDRAYYLAKKGIQNENNMQQCQQFIDQLSQELIKRNIRINPLTVVLG